MELVVEAKRDGERVLSMGGDGFGWELAAVSPPTSVVAALESDRFRQSHYQVVNLLSQFMYWRCSLARLEEFVRVLKNSCRG
jgi:hypothetical protein